MKKVKAEDINIIWSDRKRITFLGLPLTFTKYSLSAECLFIQTGCFTINEDEVKLYRITDIGLKRGFIQRIFGLGTLKINSADKTLGDFEIKNIKQSKEVKNLISKQVEIERDRKRVGSREYFGESSVDEYNDIDEQEV
jgi:hypothetical protein